ncbi:hypothetical protein DLAC_05606 [Tieghemostelium lacteum]|uniref:F-box domain-containing protein n=1 Tax=Tieghemostelium lacteum TaxID=361077 RepID=A0A151ZG99_TIELA|nr:hypothetical protein DLAC_05606 [Tieghemostelium lacteum]|eukprot:KYQ93002.1 hypothetical protein DLAC_05606 [Tieghemostelium lacteum]
MIHLPNYVIFNILIYILDNDYLTFKYKLSLGLISKSIFKFVSENINIRTSQLIQREFRVHLDNQYCILKSIKKLTINLYQQPLDIEYIEYLGQNIEELIAWYSSEYKYSSKPTLPLNYNTFPKLKSLKILMKKDKIDDLDLQLADYCPKVVNLDIVIQCKSKNLTAIALEYLKKLLNRINSSVQYLSLSIVDRSHTKIVIEKLGTLVDYLMDYKPNQLKSINFDCVDPIMYKKILSCQIESLLNLFCNQSILIDSALDIVELCNHLEILTLCNVKSQQVDRIFQLINLKPSIYSLTIINYIVDLDTREDYQVPPPTWYLRKLSILGLTGLETKLLKSNTLPDTIHSIRKLSMITKWELLEFLPSILLYLRSNTQLESLKLKIHITASELVLSEQLSLELSKHPSLLKLSLILNSRDYRGSTRICKYLHTSKTLQYIKLDLSNYFVIFDKPKIATPFYIYKNDISIHHYFRDFNIEMESIDTSWYNYLKKLLKFK